MDKTFKNHIIDMPKYTLYWNNKRSTCSFDTKEEIIEFIKKDLSNIERFNKPKSESDLLAELADITRVKADELIVSVLKAFEKECNNK